MDRVATLTRGLRDTPTGTPSVQGLQVWLGAPLGRRKGKKLDARVF